MMEQGNKASNTLVTLEYLRERPIKAVLVDGSGLVKDSTSSSLLYTLGFGKGILSRSKPVFFDEAQRKQNSNAKQKSETRREEDRPDFHRSKRPRVNSESADNGGTSDKMNVDDKEMDSEPLQLMPEELFFLALQGAVNASVNDKQLDTNALWEALKVSVPKLLVTFPVYYYYKRRGWSVKHGLKFGVDFVLYSGSAEAFHSKYGVLIRCENGNGDPVAVGGGTAEVSWTSILSTMRVLSQSMKSMIVATAVMPSTDISYFDKIEKLNEVVVKEVEVSRVKK